MPGIDQFSVVSLIVTTTASGGPLTSATAFLWKSQDATYLVSNWHVFSGRHPSTGQPLSRDGGIPDTIRVAYNDEHKLGTWRLSEHRLYDNNDTALWIMHSRGQDIDIAAMRIDQPPHTRAFHMNAVPQADQMSVSIATDLFIVGFPFGIATGGAFPIWKRGSIASEPEVPVHGLPFFYADTATREGMSGSPVYARTFGQFVGNDGSVVLTGGANTRFLGVYSGRVGADDEMKAQLGMVWVKEALIDVIERGIRGGYSLRARASST